jgi:hypothetical protein
MILMAVQVKKYFCDNNCKNKEKAGYSKSNIPHVSGRISIRYISILPRTCR